MRYVSRRVKWVKRRGKDKIQYQESSHKNIKNDNIRLSKYKFVKTEWKQEWFYLMICTLFLCDKYVMSAIMRQNLLSSLSTNITIFCYFKHRMIEFYLIPISFHWQFFLFKRVIHNCLTKMNFVFIFMPYWQNTEFCFHFLCHIDRILKLHFIFHAILTEYWIFFSSFKPYWQNTIHYIDIYIKLLFMWTLQTSMFMYVLFQQFLSSTFKFD